MKQVYKMIFRVGGTASIRQEFFYCESFEAAQSKLQNIYPGGYELHPASGPINSCGHGKVFEDVLRADEKREYILDHHKPVVRSPRNDFQFATEHLISFQRASA